MLTHFQNQHRDVLYVSDLSLEISAMSCVLNQIVLLFDLYVSMLDTLAK